MEIGWKVVEDDYIYIHSVPMRLVVETNSISPNLIR